MRDWRLVIKMIKRCSGVGSLKSVHACLVRSRSFGEDDDDELLRSSLISRYVSLGSIRDARAVCLYNNNNNNNNNKIVVCNVMIKALVDCSCFLSSLLFYRLMLCLPVRPDHFTFPPLLKASAPLLHLPFALQLHQHLIVFGFHSLLFTSNSLISLYANLRSPALSLQVFDNMPLRNTVSWSAMIGAFSLNACHHQALSLFRNMLRQGFTPHRPALLNAMSCVRTQPEADEVWGAVVRAGFDTNLHEPVQTAALAMYARCGRIHLARRFFDGMVNKDLVSWASMMQAYVQADLPLEALSLFNHLLLLNSSLDFVTLLTVIRACSVLGSLQVARAIHGITIRGSFTDQLELSTALVDLYVKCGSLACARTVFDRMPQRNIISWSTMVSGYGMHGHGREALCLFNEMRVSLKPDRIIFVAILSACSHAGLVSEGWEYFNAMSRDFGLTPRVEHYACMVDLLGRAGKMDEACEFIKRMPVKPAAGVWGALLGACRIHFNLDLALAAATALFELDAGNPGRYVLLSNIYALSGKREEANRIRTLMSERGVRKTAGHTIIEVKNKVYTFVAGDTSHPQTSQIYSELEKIMERIRQEGYTPDTNIVLHDVEEETKENMLYMHSEKLAIVFGLLNLGKESVIRMRKNLRVCGDCHAATKYISQVTGREIVVRDAHRFHHFKDGACSCNDYW